MLACLLVLFAAHLFLSPPRAARLFKLHRESRLWVRLTGVLGICFVGLSLLTDPRLNLAPVSSSVIATLVKARNLLAGAVLTFFLVLHTERFERGPVDLPNKSKQTRKCEGVRGQ